MQQPRKQHISGFLELLPNEQAAFDAVLQRIRHVFTLHGFSAFDTSAIERTETLLAKGNDHEIYGVNRLGAQTHENELALRFDLTVPLARYVAHHYGVLSFPFRRYHIAPVWRGERPQAGRYRQFYQCDVDVISNGPLNEWYDAEMISILFHVFQALHMNVVISLNHRDVLYGLLEGFNLPENTAHEAMRIIDKKEKIPPEIFATELTKMHLQQEHIDTILRIEEVAEIYQNDECHNTTNLFLSLKGLSTNETYSNGIIALENLYNHVMRLGVAQNALHITPLLARGLTYYTGSVYEVVWKDATHIGSIGGGGRYEGLCKQFNRPSLMGVGASVGVSRFFPILLERELVDVSQHTSTKVLIAPPNPNDGAYHRWLQLRHTLQQNRVATELDWQSQNLKQTLRYADLKGIPFIVAPCQNDAKKAFVRCMETGQQKDLLLCDIAAYLFEKVTKTSA